VCLRGRDEINALRADPDSSSCSKRALRLAASAPDVSGTVHVGHVASCVAGKVPPYEPLARVGRASSDLISEGLLNIGASVVAVDDLSTGNKINLNRASSMGFNLLASISVAALRNKCLPLFVLKLYCTLLHSSMCGPQWWIQAVTRK